MKLFKMLNRLENILPNKALMGKIRWRQVLCTNIHGDNGGISRICTIWTAFGKDLPKMGPKVPKKRICKNLLNNGAYMSWCRVSGVIHNVYPWWAWLKTLQAVLKELTNWQLWSEEFFFFRKNSFRNFSNFGVQNNFLFFSPNPMGYFW